MELLNTVRYHFSIPLPRRGRLLTPPSRTAQKTSHRLEWIIILLIAFEISIVLLREGFALFGEDDEEKKVKPAH